MKSAHLKISRAERHLAELAQLLRQRRPFGYYLESNFETGERATFAKRNEEVANEAAVVIGDVLHNLRSALDHAFWDCTEKAIKSDDEKRKIQFPVSRSADAFKESFGYQISKRVSEDFADAVEGLKPYREGGNHFLCAIHDLDVIDKHKLLVPTGNFTRINSDDIKKEVPDFPGGLMNCGAGTNRRDVGWRVNPMSWTQRRKAKVLLSNVVERELNVPVEIVLESLDRTTPAMQILQELINLTKHSVGVMFNAAGLNVDSSVT